MMINDTERRALLLKLSMAMTASCSCMTKTNEPQYHEEHCLYRVLNEAHAALSTKAQDVGEQEALKERDRLGYAVVKLVRAVDNLLAEGSDEYLHNENGDFTYEEAPSDAWAELRTAADDMVLRAEDYEEKYRAMLSAAPAPSPCTPEEAAELANNVDLSKTYAGGCFLVSPIELAAIINADRQKR